MIIYLADKSNIQMENEWRKTGDRENNADIFRLSQIL